MKRAFIIHGWGGEPTSNWHPWLKKELERNNFEVEVPTMPNTDAPEMESWVEKLIETVGKAEEEKKIAKPWLDNKINFDKVKKNCNRIVAIFSDNDPFVDLEENKLAFEKLNAEIIIEKNKGHFDDESKITKLPSALKAVLKLAGE